MEKILLVDDEPDIVLLAKQKFRKQIAAHEFELLFCHNGEDALELVHHDPDIGVVISDINMPGMDGISLLGKVKSFNPSIKTIVISAYSDIKTIRSAMHVGVYDFIVKPIDFNELGVAISDQ